MTLWGILCSLKILSWNILATPCEVISVVVGKSLIILENRSTITIMAFFPYDSGSGPMRSTDMISHGELGISFGFRRVFFP